MSIDDCEMPSFVVVYLTYLQWGQMGTAQSDEFLYPALCPET